MKALVTVLALLVASIAFAAPPYDVTVTVTAPSSGGPVADYRLLLNGTDVGSVMPGANSFPGLLTADGTYTFQVNAVNAAGTTASDPVTYTVTQLQPPGKPTVTVQIVCNPCVITGQ